MSLKKPFIQDSSNVFMQNKLLIAIVFFIAALNVWDSIQISNLRDDHTTIIYPYGDVEPYRIRHNSANLAYTYDMAKYIIYLYTNHDSLTVKDNYEILLSMFHPSTLPRYQVHLRRMATDFAKYINIAHVGQVNRHDGVVQLKNKLTIRYSQSRITGMAVQPPRPKVIEIEYLIENGRFWIVEMTETTYKPEEGRLSHE